MAQSSGPISQGTTAERQFTDVQWRNLFGDEPGVISDLDGSAYALSLPGSGDVVSVGSSTQASLAKVAGFVHTIPQSTPETITIPAAVGSTRTDIIGLRYDPAYTGLPGPVRLYRTVGSTASIPSYDSSPPGVEDLPLFAITRAVGQALNLATVTRMFPRIAPVLELPVGAALPTSSPLGTIIRQGTVYWHRMLNPTTPAWVAEPSRVTLNGTGSETTPVKFWQGKPNAVFSAISFSVFTVNYASAGFSSAPAITATPTAGDLYALTATTHAITATSCQLTIRSPINISATVPIHVHAIGT